MVQKVPKWAFKACRNSTQIKNQVTSYRSNFKQVTRGVPQGSLPRSCALHFIENNLPGKIQNDTATVVFFLPKLCGHNLTRAVFCRLEDAGRLQKS